MHVPGAASTTTPADYARVCHERDDITLANIALILLHQTDYLLHGLLERLKADFLTQGGIKEQMSQARRNWRESHGWNKRNGGNYGNNGSFGSYGSYGNNGNNEQPTQQQPTDSNTQ